MIDIGFGYYCTIEQKRYGVPNEFYRYKVIGRKKSNSWTDVPVDARNDKESLHDDIHDVVTVVCDNLDDRTVHQFRVSDLASIIEPQLNVPDGFTLVKNVHPDVVVHNQGLSLFNECRVIYGWKGKSKDFKDALNKGFYHGVKLGAKAVLETGYK